MATLHIRALKDSVKEKLRVRAARNGRSMEAEARAILEDATAKREAQEHPYHIIRRSWPNMARSILAHGALAGNL